MEKSVEIISNGAIWNRNFPNQRKSESEQLRASLGPGTGPKDNTGTYKKTQEHIGNYKNINKLM